MWVVGDRIGLGEGCELDSFCFVLVRCDGYLGYGGDNVGSEMLRGQCVDIGYFRVDFIDNRLNGSSSNSRGTDTFVHRSMVYRTICRSQCILSTPSSGLQYKRLLT